MSLLQMYAMFAAPLGGPTVDAAAIGSNSQARSGGACTTKVKIDSDGDYYKSDNVGAFSTAYATWLTSGSNNEVWVERTIDSGNLTTDDIGASRVSCSTDRVLGVAKPTIGVATTWVTIKFYDAASGGNLLASKQIELVAERID